MGISTLEVPPIKLNQLNIVNFNYDLAVRRVLFDSGLRQTKAALASTKADLSSLPEYKNLLLAAQKQLLELPLICHGVVRGFGLWSGDRRCQQYFDLICQIVKITRLREHDIAAHHMLVMGLDIL